MENLSLIPGNVGASPMQNIGAYGVEVKDHFAWLDAVRIEDGALERFDASKCQLVPGKRVQAGGTGKWIIVRVAFHLDRESPLRMGYGAIEHELASIPVERRTHRDVSEAVIRIRQSKPDPTVVGNAGSFFKTPPSRQPWPRNSRRRTFDAAVSSRGRCGEAGGRLAH